MVQLHLIAPNNYARNLHFGLVSTNGAQDRPLTPPTNKRGPNTSGFLHTIVFLFLSHDCEACVTVAKVVCTARVVMTLNRVPTCLTQSPVRKHPTDLYFFLSCTYAQESTFVHGTKRRGEFSSLRGVKKVRHHYPDNVNLSQLVNRVFCTGLQCGRFTVRLLRPTLRTY